MKPEFIIERQNKTFVLYAGLLDQAHHEGLKSIRTVLIQAPSEANGHTAIVQAEVETSRGTFTGIGDAAPGNVTRMIVPHLIRMAETRGKARALRDAINVGAESWEETSFDEGEGRTQHPGQPAPHETSPTTTASAAGETSPPHTAPPPPAAESAAELAPPSMVAAIEKLLTEIARIEGRIVTPAEVRAAAEGRFLSLHGHPLASGAKAEVARLYNDLATEKKTAERQRGKR